MTASALSGAAVGAGFSVTTWSPWICVVGNDIVGQSWVQLILLLCVLPMAAAIAVLSVPISRCIWKGGLQYFARHSANVALAFNRTLWGSELLQIG